MVTRIKCDYKDICSVIFVSQVGLYNWMVWCVVLLEDIVDVQCVGVRVVGGVRYLIFVGVFFFVKRGRQMGVILIMMLDRVRILSDGFCRGLCWCWGRVGWVQEFCLVFRDFQSLVFLQGFFFVRIFGIEFFSGIRVEVCLQDGVGRRFWEFSGVFFRGGRFCEFYEQG